MDSAHQKTSRNTKKSKLEKQDQNLLPSELIILFIFNLNFLSTNAKKSIKGSNKLDSSPVSNKNHSEPLWSSTVVPKLGVNYSPGVTCNSSTGNTEPISQCCSVLWVITAKEIFNLEYEKFLLMVIRQNRSLDLGNCSNKFGNHWSKGWALGQVTWAKIAKKLLHLWRHSQKTVTPNQIFLFFVI